MGGYARPQSHDWRLPSGVFLIEGHTDAVGSDIDNLSLSDRRAESVALVLSEQFGVTAEKLTTQGYGEQYLKVPTQGPELGQSPRDGVPHHAAFDGSERGSASKIGLLIESTGLEFLQSVR